MRKPAVLLAISAVAVGLTACGGSSNTTTSAPTSTATQTSTAPAPAAAGGSSIAANPSGQLKFTKSSLTAKAGTVTIHFTNSSPVAHNFTLQQGSSGPAIGATPTFQGGTKTLSVKLQPGTYTFYCSVPGHRQAGMVGTLTVS
jgi:uncharacterized cupredoxin-like copper-binding protein